MIGLAALGLYFLGDVRTWEPSLERVLQCRDCDRLPQVTVHASTQGAGHVFVGHAGSESHDRARAPPASHLLGGIIPVHLWHADVHEYKVVRLLGSPRHTFQPIDRGIDRHPQATQHL
jgi:hypothetical protein